MRGVAVVAEHAAHLPAFNIAVDACLPRIDLGREEGFAGLDDCLSPFRNVLGARLYSKAIEDRCRRALSPEEFWDVVQEVGREFQCVHVRMSLFGSVHEVRDDTQSTGGACCTLRIQLSAGDYVNLKYPVSQSMRNAVALATVVEVLQGAVILSPNATDPFASHALAGSAPDARLPARPSSGPVEARG